jgi:hypothetical protein
MFAGRNVCKAAKDTTKQLDQAADGTGEAQV